MRLENIEDKGVLKLVSLLVKEEITKMWLKDILLGNRFRASHHSREFTEAGFFNHYIWDNLSDEQKKRTIESLNMLIEEDIFSEKVYGNNYCFILLELTECLNKKNPGKLNIKPFQLWKEKNYPNLSQPIDHNHYVVKNLDKAIDSLIANK